MASKYAFSKSLHELRFLFCQTSEHSAATRSFISRAYPTMKNHNPHTPILIREASGTEPRVYARYALGREESRTLKDMDERGVEGVVGELVRGAAP